MNNKLIRKAVFINCYMGPLPEYTSIFLKSCEYNGEFDFIIINDNPPPEYLPSNVRFIKLTLEEISHIASYKLELDISIKHAYKLCDFKPAYGIIFSEYISQYTFWGSIDLDIILGNIGAFITDEILAIYDTISVRSEYVTGFFFLFRNNTKINNLYKYSKDYKRVFTGHDNYCFDECNYLFLPLLDGLSILDIQSDIESMTHVIKRLDKAGAIKAYFDLHVIEGISNEQLEWRNGELSTAEFEILIYHLISYKKLPYTYFPKWNKIPEHYFVMKFFFIKYSQYILVKWMFVFIGKLKVNYKKVTNYVSFLWEYNKYIFNFFLKKKQTATSLSFGLYTFRNWSARLLQHRNGICLEFSDKTIVLNKISNNKFISWRNKTLVHFTDNDIMFVYYLNSYTHVYSLAQKTRMFQEII